MSDQDPNTLMNPLIYYRVSNNATNLKALPSINLSRFYEQSGAPEDQIKFQIKKISFSSSNKRDYLQAITDVEVREDF